MTDQRHEYSPLLTGIIDQRGYSIVGITEFDTVVGNLPLAMLFLPGDYWRLAESDDVAVVLPQLDDALQGLVIPLVAARGEDERAFQRRFRFTAFPTLVFLRLGEYLGAIEGIRDWSDYLAEIPAILEREPRDPPAFKLPAGCGGDIAA